MKDVSLKMDTQVEGTHVLYFHVFFTTHCEFLSGYD